MNDKALKRVTVRYFASVREALGTASEEVQTTTATVQALRDELMARGGAYAEELASERPVRMALDQVMIQGDKPIENGSEVAFFPPVTGG